MEEDQNQGSQESTGETQETPVQGQDSRTVPYSRFQQVNKSLRALEKQLADQAAAHEAAQKRIQEMEQAQAERTRQDLVRTVAQELGLPANLAARLQGKDEVELRADAQELLKVLKPAAPDTDATKTSGTGTKDAPTFTMAQLRDSAFYQAHKDEINKALTDGRIIQD